MKNKAKEEHRKEREDQYKKGKGEWPVCKDIQREVARPMIALKRSKPGPRGQNKGTVTTKPREIDEIIQYVYGEIYRGNVIDAAHMVKYYLKKENYGKYWHKAKQATMEPLAG